MNHFTRSTTVRGALLAATALLAVGQTSAQADPYPHGHHRHGHGNWMYVTVTHGDARADGSRGSGSRAGASRDALLLCDPPRGHARAADACAELDAASGDIGAVPRKDALCPMIYAPVTARAQGVWNGTRVTYARTFSNTCEMSALTRDVFALDA
ncbi:SSI family serine proteinase inhibitor [Streptomyces sp. NPDC047000]|uniref:SSI family serine proteinase inhibitor n=1 Tax=Streptomyces sp. NPDC047000 TaxID=3155474 RepID=UPI0033FE4873